MNIYDALNQGDGSLKEPHFTSLLFYLFKVSKEEFPNRSFLDSFINKYLSEFPRSTECDFDLETDIKIEKILSHENLRRDTDIIIFLRCNGIVRIINIENKISNLAYKSNQIHDQQQLLSNLYPNTEIINILLLPYASDSIIDLSENLKIIYWYGEENSLIDIISEYISDIAINNDLQTEKLYFLKSCLGLFNQFSQVLEQDRLSITNMVRGPRNIYRHSMFDYLSQIANAWEVIFHQNPENITVNDLLIKFGEMVSNDLQNDYPNTYIDMIAKFKKGAYEAQPKIVTINEKNRVHFGINNSYDKQLFYYPDAEDGMIPGKWINRRIKPLRLMNENNQYMIYWKDLFTGTLQSAIYIPQE